MFNLLTTKQAFLDAQGNPLSGGRLWTKVSGSNTNKQTTRDADGLVPNTNPIILDSRGEVPFGVFGTTGPYRIILAAPGDLTDPPTSPIWGPRDGVSGINDFVNTSQEWQPTGLTPTVISSASFSVPGDQTAIFEPRRRVRCTVGGGAKRPGTIQSSTFGTFTTVQMVNDVTALGLDGSLSAVELGLTTATATSQPYDSARGLDIASAGTLTFPANADRFNVTGTTTISAFALSWTGRRVYLTHAGAQPLTHGVSFVLPGAVNFTTMAGDETIWEQTSSTQWKLVNYMSASTLAGLVLLSVSTFTVSGTWTRPAGCTAIEVEVVGGGGGGGGANSNSAVLGSAGAGGAGAGRTIGLILTGFGATETVTIGAGGLAGTATPGIGGTGATTSFGALMVAQGGQGGNVNTGAGVSVGATAGGSPGAGVGYSNTSGSPGSPGLVLLNAAGNAAVAVGGNGGASPVGGAALGPVTIGAASITGSPGNTRGGGGSGACVVGAGSAAGGGGSPGGCRVYEYGKA